MRERAELAHQTPSESRSRDSESLRWSPALPDSGVSSAGVRAPSRRRTAGTGQEEATSPLELIRQAEALGIPWRRILSEEILAETVLQRFLGGQLLGLPLWRALSILPSSHLNSWRVRDAVHRLSWQSSQGSREARGELARLHAALAGTGGAPGVSLAAHQWFAYQRVLELRAIAASAHRTPHGTPDPAEFLRQALACSRHDAEWALSGRSAQTDFYALEDAMRRAREEGFEIPCGETELEAFLRLRACVRRSGYLPKRRRRGAQSRRVARSADAVLP